MNFFNTFFSEKDLTEQVYTVTSANGTPNIIPSTVVIASIEAVLIFTLLLNINPLPSQNTKKNIAKTKMTALIPQMRINHSIKASRSAFPLDRCSIILSQ